MKSPYFWIFMDIQGRKTHFSMVLFTASQNQITINAESSQNLSKKYQTLLDTIVVRLIWSSKKENSKSFDVLKSWDSIHLHCWILHWILLRLLVAKDIWVFARLMVQNGRSNSTRNMPLYYWGRFLRTNSEWKTKLKTQKEKIFSSTTTQSRIPRRPNVCWNLNWWITIENPLRR